MEHCLKDSLRCVSLLHRGVTATAGPELSPLLQGLFELASKTYKPPPNAPRRSAKRCAAVTGTIDFLDAPPSESAAALQLEQRLAADAAAEAAQLASGLNKNGGSGGSSELLIAGQSGDAKAKPGSAARRLAADGTPDGGDGPNGSGGAGMAPDLYGVSAPNGGGTRRVRRPRQASPEDDDPAVAARRSKTRPRELRRVRREIDAW